MNKIKSFLKRRTKLQIGLFVILVVIIGFLFSGGESKNIETVVERGVIEQEVVATGKVSSAEEVDLGFERTGKVVRVNANVGDAVLSGSTLVVLDQSELLADIKKANAALSEARINLDKAKRTTASDYSNSYDKLYIALVDAYTDAKDSVLNTADRFFWSPTTSYYPKFEIVYVTGNQNINFYVSEELSRNISTERGGLNAAFAEWDKAIADAKTNSKDLTSVLALTERNIDGVKNFLGNIAFILNSLKNYDQTYESAISGYKTSVATARSAVNSSLSSLLLAKSEYQNSPRELVTEVGLSYDDILQAESRVESASADVESLEAELSKTVLKSPIQGILTKQDAKVGEIVSQGGVVLSVVADQKLEIDADISEVNIGKINKGDMVNISIDAFPGEKIVGTVLQVKPGEKLIDGVVNYEVTVAFSGLVPQNLKTGLTSSLYIQTERKENVLRIPSYTVVRRDGKKFVTIKTEEGESEREIEVGIMGKDGYLEVLSGLEVGEIVLSVMK